LLHQPLLHWTSQHQFHGASPLCTLTPSLSTHPLSCSPILSQLIYNPNCSFWVGANDLQLPVNLIPNQIPLPLYVSLSLLYLSPFFISPFFLTHPRQHQSHLCMTSIWSTTSHSEYLSKLHGQYDHSYSLPAALHIQFRWNWKIENTKHCTPRDGKKRWP
jgi:hypothetical protein